MTEKWSQLIESEFEASIRTKRETLGVLKEKIAEAARACIESVQNGGTIFWAGNGGSAADAQHMAAELVGRFKRERRAIKSIALTTNTSNLTAIGNDYGYEFTFDRQLEAFAKAGDVLFAISTSGNSANVLRAAEMARKADMKVIALTGKTGGKLAPLASILLNVPSTDTARIQESHLLMEHLICDCIEQSVVE
jgi:D-sedoheptulose 7-phosphate isomerase